ncbi:hypothetical protein BDK51DRAFT_32358 [Blyttiomyces helicus]|uniref:F-box domain-containing protein n=1 Tax=Blyttiomyces helicus TaxID=388810 RepID=A0A4P9WM18_9FUNG|nr:hypothetical protein BDK51DRAFT_32358 [Blyttiomyces helicus]|eukprot:RKO91736.1 hypothetical protein BDK51DRAFT_32358 [Blyttiomyces helicus]
MAKGKGARQNLKRLAEAASSSAAAASASAQEKPTPTVADLLERTRPRPQRPDPVPPALSAFALYQEHRDRAFRTAQNQSVPGPAPPPGWGWRPRHMRRSAELSEETIRKARGTRSPPSLQKLCCKFIGSSPFHLKLYAKDLPSLPFYHKQDILLHLSTSVRVTNAQLALFRDPELRSIHISASAVSLDSLAAIFPDPVVDLLEEDAEDDDDEFPGQHVGTTVAVQQAQMGAPCVEEWEELADDDDDEQVRGSPYLHTVDVSFARGIPALPFARLLCRTLPLLASLNISGCFSTADGPAALGVLSRNLSSLRRLEVSFSPWITNAVVNGIAWETRWKQLRVLVLEVCPALGVERCIREMRERRPTLEVIA